MKRKYLWLLLLFFTAIPITLVLMADEPDWDFHARSIVISKNGEDHIIDAFFDVHGTGTDDSGYFDLAIRINDDPVHAPSMTLIGDKVDCPSQNPCEGGCAIWSAGIKYTGVCWDRPTCECVATGFKISYTVVGGLEHGDEIEFEVDTGDDIEEYDENNNVSQTTWSSS